MIILFRDNSVNYWLHNSIVDCGNVESTNNLDIEFTEDISSDELEAIIESEEKTDTNKKLNKKHKHINDLKFNEPKYQKVNIGRNGEIINGDSRKKNTGNKSMGYKYKYKDSGSRIDDIQTPIKHKCVHQHFNTNHNKGKVREMSKVSNIYYHE